MLPAFLTAIFFSCSIICAGRATLLVGGTSANFFRLVVAIFCLASYAHILGQGWLGGGLFVFFLSGAVGIGIGDLASFQALSRIGPSLTALLVQCLCAPFAAVLEWWWLGHALTGQQVGGSSVILVGSALALLSGAATQGNSKLNWRSPIVLGGVFLAGLAALAQAVGAVLTRRANEINLVDGVVLDGMSAAYQRMSGAMIVVMVVYVCVRLIGRRVRVEPVATRTGWQKAAPWIIGNGLSGMVLGVACFQWSLQKMPAAVALSIVALTPLVVIPLAWLVNGTRPSALSVLGGLIAVGGVLILLWN